MSGANQLGSENRKAISRAFGGAQLNNAENYFFDFQARHQWHLSGRQND
jgi:hypothetical protein